MSQADEKPSRARRLLRTVGEWTLTLAAVALVGTIVGRWRAPSLPDRAPALRLADLDGEIHDLAEMGGRPVVVNFWATWCGPCRVEMPLLASWAEDRDDVQVLAVSTDTDVRVVRRWVDRQQPPFPVVMADAETQRRWGVTTLPTTIVVDADGRIHHAHTGMILPPQLSLMLP